MSLYEGSLLSSLIKVSLTVPFKGRGDLADLVLAGSWKVVSTPGTYYFDMLQMSDTSAFRRMREALE